MKINLVSNFALGLLICLATQASFGRLTPTPTISEHSVNGYRVLLINQHDGNHMRIGVHVPTGAWHDDPVIHAGRAHLWEHVFHRGSKRFPDGEKAFARAAKRNGGTQNAYTSRNHTLYFGSGHPDALPEIIDYLGAMFSEPLLTEENFRPEQKVVMNESFQYQAYDSEALIGGIFLSLLPAGHPLAMYTTGTQEQLINMDLDDLKDLFYSNYGPDSVTIVIAGNFDHTVNTTPPLNSSRILSMLGENFVPAHDPRPSPKHPELFRPSRELVLPSIVIGKRNQLRMVEIGANSESKTLKLIFEVPNQLAREGRDVLETIFDYLNLQFPGSFMSLLRSHGWVTEVEAYTSHINNLSLSEITFELTENGAQHRNEVVTLFLTALRQLRDNGMTPEVLEFIRKRNINDYSNRIRSPQFSSGFVIENLEMKDLSRIFDFQARFGHIANNDVQQMVAQAFDLDKMLVGYIGDDVEGDSKLPIFDRPSRKIKDKALYKTWKSAFTSAQDVEVQIRPIIKTIPLQFSKHAHPKLSSEPKEFLGAPEGAHAYLVEDHRNPTGALSLELKLAPPSIETMAARLLFKKAFQLRYKDIFTYLSGLPMDVVIAVDTEGWLIQMEGNSLATRQALEWTLAELRKFKPTDKEIRTAKQYLVSSHLADQDDFAGSIAVDHAYRSLDRYESDPNELIQVIKTLEPQQARELATKDLQRVDFRLIAAGDFVQDETEQLVLEIEALHSTPLTSAERTALKEAGLTITEPMTPRWKPLAEIKTEDDFGQARVYGGPALMSREAAALRVATPSIAESVFQLNRAQRGLGYIHNAKLIPSGGHLHLTLYGETSDPKRWPEIAQGWEEVSHDIRTTGLNREDILDGQLGLQRAHQLAPQTSLEVIATILASLDFYGDAQGYKRMGALMSSLTVEEIQEAAAKTLGSRTFSDVMTSTKPPAYCQNLFISEE